MTDNDGTKLTKGLDETLNFQNLLNYSKSFKESKDMFNFNIPRDLLMNFLDVRKTFVLRLQISKHYKESLRFVKPRNIHECFRLIESSEDEMLVLIYFMYFLGFKNNIISSSIDTMLERLK